jgi:hypothetical protein
LHACSALSATTSMHWRVTLLLMKNQYLGIPHPKSGGALRTARATAAPAAIRRLG